MVWYTSYMNKKSVRIGGLVTVIAIITMSHTLFIEAASCSVFSNGTVIKKIFSAYDTPLVAGVKKKGLVVKVVDAQTCSTIDSAKFAKQKKKRKLATGNLWHQDGTVESGEVVVTERLSKTKLKVRIYTMDTPTTLTLLAKKTLTVEEGAVTLSIKDKRLTVNDTDYQLVMWNDTPKLAPVNQSLQFFTFGDQGEEGDDKNQVAAAMNTIAQTLNDISFVGTLGDNFYPPDTIESVDDEDWLENFRTPYSLTGLDVPFYIALGNHDYDDNTLEAIVSYQDETNKWTLPSNYYAFTYPVNSETPLLEYIVIDSEMIDNEDEGYVEQLQWLDDTLTASTAQWTVVAAHHPVYSYGQHGDTTSIKTNVLPLLVEHGVDLYVAGHDHDKQFIDWPDDNITYVVSGAGSRLRDTTQGANSLFAASTLGFTSFTVLQNKISIDFYDTEAQREFQYILSK